MNSIVRLLDISINSFKNLEYGIIKLNSYTSAKKEFKLKKGDLLGVYGQNGSGKTALIEAIDILRLLLTGGRLPKDIRALITSGKEVCTLEATFYIEGVNHKYLAYYEVSIRTVENSFVVANESLSFSILDNGKWKVMNKLIGYCFDEKDFFKPACRYRVKLSVQRPISLRCNMR